MRCDTVRINLKSLLDRELRGLARGRVRHHLNHCVECVAEWEALRRTDALLRASDLFPSEMSLISAVRPPLTKGVGKLTRTLAGGLAVTAALTIGLLMAPRPNNALTPASRVKQALQNVNTWHLTGWTLVEGERVPWEIWGRRAPFFYREQAGNDVVLDNGRERVVVIGPNRKGRKQQGVFLRAPSAPEPENVRWSYEDMIAHWHPQVSPAWETATEVIFNANEVNTEGPGTRVDKLYTISKRTWLPIQYELRRSNARSKQTEASLRIEYDVPIPQTAQVPPISPKGYAVYDTQSAPANVPTENVATKGNLTVQMTPLLMDNEGNILVRVQGWYGSTPLDDQGAIRLNVAQPLVMRKADAISPAPCFLDDRQRLYAEVYWDELIYGRPSGAPRMMLFTPLEPLEPEGTLPNTLTITVSASLVMPSSFSSAMGIGGDQLFEHDLTITMRLPEPIASLETGVKAYLDPDWQKRVFTASGSENLAASLYIARSRHYSYIQDTRRPVTPEIRRAAYWMEKYITKATSQEVQFHRSRLSNIYWQMGNTKRAQQLLQDIIADRRFDRPLSMNPNAPLADRQRWLREQRESAERERKHAEQTLRKMEIWEKSRK